MNILLVEDNEGDILLTTETLEEGQFTNNISVVKDGKDAIDFLSKKGKFLHVHLPDLILLDINMPKINGYEVLQHIKGSETLKEIPVIMLTTSSSQQDSSFCQKNFANGYIIKPLEVSKFMAILKTLRKDGSISPDA